MQALGLQDSGCWSCRCRDCGSSSIPSSGGPDSSLSHRGYIKAQPQAFAYERGASGFGFCKVHNFALSNCSPRTPCTKLACRLKGLGFRLIEFVVLRVGFKLKSFGSLSFARHISLPETSVNPVLTPNWQPIATDLVNAMFDQTTV